VLDNGDKVPAALMRAPFGVSLPQPGSGAASAEDETSLAALAPEGKTLVLFFYPKDSTPGCTREAQAFSAAKKAFEKAGGVVVGVSRDSLKSHASFRTKYALTIPLLSDPERKLHEAFGAWGEKTMYGKKVLGTIRSTFLVRAGKVLQSWPKVKVDGHEAEVLDALKAQKRA
jgi:peroxiredoxin Q/BCP